MIALVADALVLLGLVVIALAVLGMFRMPDVYSQIQATAKASSLGIVVLLLAALAAGEGSIAARVVLIAAFLLVTAPVGAHSLARAAHIRGEPEDGVE